MELQVINTQGQANSSLSVDDSVFARDYNEALVHQVVKAFLANARSGTRAQKTRSEVSKSTRKPFKQKGTGRARAGMASSPLWRGGGKIFPNRPDENFAQKTNRRMYRAAMASILSQLVRDDRLVVADKISIDTPKTKAFVSMLKTMSLADQSVLMIVNEFSEELFLASRNLPNVLILEAHQIDPYSLMRFKKVVLEQSTIEELQEQLA